MDSASALERQQEGHHSERETTAAERVSQLVVAEYLPRIHRFAVMVSPLGADPDDLTQEACARVLERWRQFDPRRGTLDAWLWRIVVNLARDAGRASRRSQLLAARFVQQVGTASAAASPENLALDRLRQEQVIAAVRRLSRRHRTVVAMRYGAGLTTVEIAACLGSTRIATAKALRRALDRLRADLAELEERG